MVWSEENARQKTLGYAELLSLASFMQPFSAFGPVSGQILDVTSRVCCWQSSIMAAGKQGWLSVSRWETAASKLTSQHGHKYSYCWTDNGIKYSANQLNRPPGHNAALIWHCTNLTWHQVHAPVCGYPGCSWSHLPPAQPSIGSNSSLPWGWNFGWLQLLTWLHYLSAP